MLVVGAENEGDGLIARWCGWDGGIDARLGRGGLV